MSNEMSNEMRTISIFGTEEELGEDYPKEVRCMNECDGGDVCVSTETGICSVCKEQYIIEDTTFFLEDLDVSDGVIKHYPVE